MSAGEGETRTIHLKHGVLLKNDLQATQNRERFRSQGLLVLNVLASPGSGKTALLERTLLDLGPRISFAVLVGDLATDNDARRLAKPGVSVRQITTGGVCHLEASMIARACDQLELTGRRILFIENVGNLVCPASYDLGEERRVVLLSVTEGEDKPLKYPKMFKTADLVLITKCDLAEAVGFDRETALANVHAIAPQAPVLEVSARTGDGMPAWYAFLEGLLSTNSSH
jgi:hydrogenase nickel incorporation protein HypB